MPQINWDDTQAAIFGYKAILQDEKLLGMIV